MGLFGFVGKALGKVIKTGLGVATQGVSNQVFDFIDAKKRSKAMTAAAAKYMQVRPKIKGDVRLSTGRNLDWGSTMDTYGESVGERQERLRRQRLANLAKARAARRKADK